MDEPPSPLLKSRIPRKTILADPHADPFRFTDDREFRLFDAHCPLRKGIICYHRSGTIFEHNIHSSGKHEPRIIVPNHPSRRLEKISFVPIKGNRVLLFAKYSSRELVWVHLHYLYLSIHEIHSNHRVGAALWSFNGSVDGQFDIDRLELIKSTENELGITFWLPFDNHLKLFDISTTESDASNNLPLIESGRIDFDVKFKLKWAPLDGNPVILSPDTCILLNVDLEEDRYNETIDIHYLDSGGTDFSFITRLSIPIGKTSLEDHHPPELAFSTDGSKFAMAMCHSRVSVWNLQSKVPLQTFTELQDSILFPRSLQFSSGNSGKEILVFVEHDDVIVSHCAIIHVIDMTSLETEERLFLMNEDHALIKLFFDPHEGTMYAELDRTIYEWDLWKKEPGPEWWIGEE